MRTPTRTLATAQLVNSIGDGAFYVSSALFFAHVVGLSALQIGTGLTVGWAVGLLAGVPVGRLADRLGPRPVAIGTGVVTAAAIAVFLVVDGPVAFTLACVAYAAAQTGSGAARQALLALVVAPAERTAARARIQATANAGIGIGAAIGGLALLADAPLAFEAVFALDALGFLAAAVLLRGLPAGSPRHERLDGAHRIPDPARTGPASTGAPSTGAPSTGAPGTGAPSTDTAGADVGTAAPAATRIHPRYAAISLLNSLMLLYMPMLSVVAPLWIASRTAAPAWVVAVLFVVNTAGVVLTQVRAGRTVRDVRTAGRAVRRAGVLLLASCVAFAASALGAGPWVATAVLLGAAVLQVAGEVLLSAGGWQLSFDLAPADAQGAHQGFFAMGSSVARAAGPLLLTGLVLGGGTLGWLALGAVFVLAGFAMSACAQVAGRVGAVPVP
ncbi:MFS transporter [Pseudonocardia ailaonensis]|uniref:MFS transporter n=1 Tax=Pseudonocardia ailaonensis TaxID=367279 RepID=A0ABN2NCL7_9PSEU